MPGFKPRSLIVPIAFSALTVAMFAGAQHTYKPTEGFVTNAKTAIAIAVAVWEPIYGEEQIASEKPYKATLKDGVWTVAGSLPEAPNGGIVLGGVAEADIAKDDSRILRVTHGR